MKSFVEIILDCSFTDAANYLILKNHKWLYDSTVIDNSFIIETKRKYICDNCRTIIYIKKNYLNDLGLIRDESLDINNYYKYSCEEIIMNEALR